MHGMASLPPPSSSKRRRHTLSHPLSCPRERDSRAEREERQQVQAAAGTHHTLAKKAQVFGMEGMTQNVSLSCFLPSPWPVTKRGELLWEVLSLWIELFFFLG